MGEYNSEPVREVEPSEISNLVPVLDSIDNDRAIDDVQEIREKCKGRTQAAIHGFHPFHWMHPEARHPEDIWKDRFNTAFEVANELEDKGYLDSILISGGGNFDGRSESQVMYEWAEEKDHPVMEFEEYIEKEEISETTTENVLRILERGYEEEVNYIVPITSFDHIGRVSEEFERIKGLDKEELSEYNLEQLQDYSPAIYPVTSRESFRDAESLKWSDFHLSEDITYHLEELSSYIQGAAETIK